MRWIKKFETFDFSQTLPLASKSDLTLFYHCDDCDALWKVLNNEVNECKFCKSSSIEELSKDEWYETVGDRLDDDEKEDLESERISDDEEFLDLYNLKKGNNYVD
jgi:hypothetical protein